MGAIASAIGAILASILGAVFDALRGKRQDEDRIATHEEAAVAEAAEETADVIADAADARSALPGATADADELARRLRGRKTGANGGH